MNVGRTTSDNRKKAFLAAFAECATISGACRASGVGRSTHYDWMRADTGYAAEFEQAAETAADDLEAEARRRAKDGVRRLKFDKDGDAILDPDTGKPYVEHQYSDTLLIFLLKAARPEKFRERYEVRHDATGNLGDRLRAMSVDEARQLVASRVQSFLEPAGN